MVDQRIKAPIFFDEVSIVVAIVFFSFLPATAGAIDSPVKLSSAAADNAKALSVGTSSPTARGQRLIPIERPQRLAIGINDLGGQLRLHVTPHWAGELRFQTGNASSNEGSIHSLVVGLRGYRFYDERHGSKFYIGLEGDYAQTSIKSATPITSPAGGVGEESGFGNTSGYVGGAFGGIEFRFLRRFAIDLDAGPYLISLKEKVTGVSDSNWDFVMNAAMNIYLF